MKPWATIAAIAIWLAGGLVRSDEPTTDKAVESSAKAKEAAAPEDPAHAELRKVRDGLIEAIKKSDIDAILGYLDSEVVVTWQNGEVSRKPEGVKAYYERVMKGPKRVVESYTSSPTVDELTHLYGDTGVAFGSSLDRYKLTDGSDFELPTRWSATLVKADGKWRIANFHASVNMFDNPVMWIAVKKVAMWAAVIAAVSGLVVGFVLARTTGKRPAAPAKNA